MNHTSDDKLIHYGVLRRSGRYPWGSGENPYQRSGDLLSRIDELKGKGMSEKEIAESMNLTTTQLRIQLSLAKAERRAIEVAKAKDLRDKGYSLNEIAKMMGYDNDSSVRSLLNSESETRMNQAKQTADFLKKMVKEKGMIDVGSGVERELGISKEKLNQALYILELEGYPVYGGGVPQATNKGRQTNLKVLCPPETEHKDIYNFEKINTIHEYASHDGGDTFDKLVYPKSMDSKRIMVRYAEDGGIDKDGLIEIRRGVDDLSLGASKYAQVRILVDDKKYMKGMAVYSDNLPDGIDIIFNTNKTKDIPKEKVFKDITNDPDNPFGSLIKAGGQSYYIDKDGKKQLSVINKRAEEGDWGEWSDKLSSQFLSKQNLPLIKKQLNLSAADKQAEFDEIMSLTNPTIKKVLLKSFADDCDAAAVHLKAAALPRQKYQVIIPMPSLKDNEVYAPNYKNGEEVALIRYPHGGTFEIPILKVNNKNPEGKRLIGLDAADAIGINKKVADRLSGADFDGDTVMVIPVNSKVKIKSTPPLKDLENFDPKMEYGHTRKEEKKIKDPKTGKEEIQTVYYRGDKPFKEMKNTQTEMGKISNLITDMTLLGATEKELARAVRHSMVVIDAAKHKLDYKQSEIDNDIATLKRKYQGHYDEQGRYKEGAGTLISRAKSEVSVLKRKGTPSIDPKTGNLLYKEVEETYTDPKTGKIKVRTQQSTRMAETDNAYTLISDANTPTERLYADYANKMKALANQARKSILTAGKIQYSPSAKETYKTEVSSLMSQLNVSLKNAPKERKAQLLANAAINAKKQANPDLTKSELKKLSQIELTKARNQVGAKRETIKISDKEWEAIQAGAISENKLMQILNHTDVDILRQKATPKMSTTLSQAKINKISSMNASGYTTSEIAEALGISSSTVTKYLKGGE